MIDTATPVHIIGGGLAGSEAAWQLARRNVPVILHEMRDEHMTPAHQTGQLAELVCSNSFRSDDADHNAVGLLHEEMRHLDSLVMQAAAVARVPAGSALAVDRDIFAAHVTQALGAEPLVTIRREEVTAPDDSWRHLLIASGPLTSDALASWVAARTGEEHLAFFDAIAPIVHSESIDMDIAWRQSRYDKRADGSPHPPGEGDYINCPLDKEQYEAFVAALNNGETVEFHEWEGTPYFEGCMPIEVMAARGPETLRFGPMKPVGLRDPRTGKRPWAVVQLRHDNQAGTLMNIVGFQTKLKYGEQTRILRMIPGLEQAEFARLGGLHRNSFIRAPALLDRQLRLKDDQRIRFAGQITGCEGYVEAAATGLIAGRFLAAEVRGKELVPPPTETALGALLAHITGEAVAETYQPMNVNFGLFPELVPPPLNPRGRPLKGRERKAVIVARARAAFGDWLKAA